MDPELRRRVKVVAAVRDQSVKEWIEGVVRETLIREYQEVAVYAPDGPDSEEDRTWLDNDLSGLEEFDPYEWDERELEEGRPVSYEPGAGIVVVEGGRRRGRE